MTSKFGKVANKKSNSQKLINFMKLNNFSALTLKDYKYPRWGC